MNKERTILYGILTHYSHDDGQNDVYLENKPKIAKSLTLRHEYDWEDYLYYEDGYTVITSPRYIENIDFTIPHTITSIGEYAFCGIDFIRHLVIPKSVTSIGRGAFAKCNFEVLRILKSDLKIDSSIFNDGDISFDGCYIEVPKGCKKVYKAMLLDLPDINLFDYVIESQ